MKTLCHYLLRYCLAVLDGFVGYYEWAKRTAKDERDLRCLALLPAGLFALVMLALPTWAVLLFSVPLLSPIVLLTSLGLVAWVRR